MTDQQPRGMRDSPWSPDGKRLRVFRKGDMKYPAVLIDADTGAEVAPLGQYPARSPDGRHWVALQETTARVVDADTGAEVCTLPGAGIPNHWPLSWSPDGKRLLGWTPGHATVWDAATGQEVCTISSPDVKDQGPFWGPDGKRLLVVADARLIAWDSADGHELIRFDLFPPAPEGGTGPRYYPFEPEALSPEGLRVAVVDQAGVIRVRDLTTGQELLALRGCTAGARSTWKVRWSPDGRWLLVQETDWASPHPIEVFDAASEQEGRPIYGNARLSDVAWSPDGRRLAGVGSVFIEEGGGPFPDAQRRRRAGRLTIWDPATGQGLSTWTVDFATHGVAWSPDGTRLATVGMEPGDGPPLFATTVEFWGTIKIWDAHDGTLLRSWRAHSTGSRLAWSPDGSRLASLGEQYHFRPNGPPTGTLVPTSGFAPGVALPRNESEEEEVKVWDPDTGKEYWRFAEPLERAWNHPLAWSPDGSRLLAGVGRTTRVLDAANGKVVGNSNLEVFALGPHKEPGGPHLALAENEIRIHAFSPPGELVRTLPGHRLGTAAVAWSPDGRHLVSRGGEGAIKLWDATTGFEILDLPLGKGSGQPVWSPDGRRLALHPSWSDPNRVVLLDGDPRPSWPPGRAWADNRLARKLAGAAVPPADPARALALAQEAVELAPEVGAYRTTLGMARYRAGRWREAVAALEESMRLREGGALTDWFFLAMAYQQLGDREAARPFYDAAVAWMEQYKAAYDDEVRRTRAEAAATLGLEAPK